MKCADYRRVQRECGESVRVAGLPHTLPPPLSQALKQQKYSIRNSAQAVIYTKYLMIMCYLLSEDDQHAKINRFTRDGWKRTQ